MCWGDNSNLQLEYDIGFGTDNMTVASGAYHSCSIQKTFADYDDDIDGDGNHDTYKEYFKYTHLYMKKLT